MESEKKGLKRYQLKKISKGALMFFLLSGFVIGTVSGHFVFLNSQNGVIKLTMVYSSEKEVLDFRHSAIIFTILESTAPTKSEFKAHRTDFQPYGSGDSVIALLNGEVQPAIWSPASYIWIPILNAEWSQLTRSATPLAPNYTQIVYSPVVIATWENFLQAHPFTSMQGLHDLIVQNPELVKMAHTDPRDSNSGFMAMIMLVSGFLNKDPTTISLNDLANSSLLQYIRDIEKSAIFYGTSTGYLGQYMLAQGPSALQVHIFI